MQFLAHFFRRKMLRMHNWVLKASKRESVKRNERGLQNAVSKVWCFPPPKKKLNSLSGAIHRALFQQILEGSPSSSSSLQANPKSLFSVAKFVKKRNYTNAKSVGLSLRDFLAQK